MRRIAVLLGGLFVLGNLAAFGSDSALLGWGLAVAVHGLVVWLARPNSQDHEAPMIKTR